jgi:uncharacterized membrane protein YwzB
LFWALAKLDHASVAKKAVAVTLRLLVLFITL